MSRAYRRAQKKAFLKEQKLLAKYAKENQAETMYGIAQKINGRWVYVYRTLQETCRDSMFEILQHTPCPVRRVNL
tara:strand:- start:31046 stop:31270 length:225 start_codon:yes stop_codon:yes gene_type:complete